MRIMKRYSVLSLVLMMMLSLMPIHASLADGVIEKPILPVIQVDPEYADELQLALDALQAHTPGAVVDYAVRERDDGRYEWNLFFTLNGQVGSVEIPEESYEVRFVDLYDMPVDGLIAADAMAALILEKGEMTIVKLELDWDDGRLRYEGEAELDGKRYEFELNIQGKILDWERD